jgi:tRNA (guanosine-2'-O-)-methyltransferase
MKTLRAKTAVRKLHRSQTFNPIQLSFLLQDWSDPYNVGGMFRVADACGAHELIMSGKTPVPPHPQIGVTSLGHHRRVEWRQIVRHDDAIRILQEEGNTLVAVEIADDAENYRDFEYPPKTVLVLGNEQIGLHGNVIKACDAAVFIPMVGKGRSLNVHVAAAVVAFEALLPKGRAVSSDENSE